MSVKVMSWVWDHSQSKGMDRLVLLAIADCAADDGANAYPSMAKLVAKTGLTDRGIQKCLARLVESGELVVNRNAGPRGCNRYRVRMVTPEQGSPPPNVVHPEQGSPPEPDSPPPPNRVHPTPEQGSPGTVLEPSEISSSKRSSMSTQRRRGTRIPDDFTVTPEMVAWARATVPHVDGRRETEKFVNYWQARSGAGAVKVNWAATWRNWMLNAAERYGTNGHRSGTILPPSTAPQPLKPDEVCPEHRGQRKGACRYCAADAKAAGVR